MGRRRNELWYQYWEEVASLEKFGQKNIISFEEWLDIKGFRKNKKGQEYEIH